MPETAPIETEEEVYVPIITVDNSYLTLEQASEMLLYEYYTGDWEALEPLRQEQLLIRATEEVDAFRFVGVKYEKTQVLQFPRKQLPDPIYDGLIPDAILKATLRIAIALIDNNPDEVSGADTFTEVWTADVKLKSKGAYTGKSYISRGVLRLLMPFTANSGQVTLIRG